jgi:hypothetical protein
MPNYAQIEGRTAYLSTDFGEEIARKWFGDESVDSLPRYLRGPRKGKIKGAVTWSKVLRGGWVRTGRETAYGDATGYVENRVGRIFDRKLHEIESSRFGTHVGRVIRDLEAEERKEQYRRSINARIDEDIRKYEMERTCIEQVILSGKFDEHTVIFQQLIAERNEDIAILCGEFQ